MELNLLINTHDIFSTIKEVDYLQLMTMTLNLHSANNRNVFSNFSLKSILLQMIIHVLCKILSWQRTMKNYFFVGLWLV